MKPICSSALKVLLLSLPALLLSSCMHTMMTDHSSMQHDETRITLEKEVIVGDMKAVANIPPLHAGKETLFTLRLTDLITSKPLTQAKVFAHIQYSHTPDHQHSDTSQVRQDEMKQDVIVNREVEETKQQGIYELAFTPDQAGEYHIALHIIAIGERKLEKEITVEARQIVPVEDDKSSGMMQSIGSDIPLYIIIGAVVMGAIMIVSLWLRGGMF